MIYVRMTNGQVIQYDNQQNGNPTAGQRIGNWTVQDTSTDGQNWTGGTQTPTPTPVTPTPTPTQSGPSDIAGAYQSYLGRAGNQQEVAWWQQRVDSGELTMAQALQQIQTSPEGQSYAQSNTQVVPGIPNPQQPGQINVVDYTSQLATNPGLAITLDNPNTPENESMSLQDQLGTMNLSGAAQIDPNAPQYQQHTTAPVVGSTTGPATQATAVTAGTAPVAQAGQITGPIQQAGGGAASGAGAAGTAANAQQAQAAPDVTAAQGNVSTVGNTQQVANVDPRDTATYQAQTSYDQVANQQMTAAQGQVGQNSLITPEQQDMEGLYTGVNQDGSTNWAGKALNEYATQKYGTIIDTSTPAGKALAEQLGEGNYLDSKSTLKGQLEILQQEFTGPNGEPKIPSWAAATARSVGRIAAFNGLTGTAATAAMAQALLEASMPIAQQDSQFFQTLTLKNLDNKQSAILNKANVLSKFELANLDNRMTAAVENAKAFLQMDLANLSNDQQARVINMQARVQAILEDSKAVNTQRLFTAQSINEQNRFYDQLNTSINTWNAEAVNTMNQFNSAQTNSMTQFNVGQSNQVNMFNNEQRNQVSQTNAQLGTQASIATANNMTSASIATANNSTAASIATSNNQTQASIANANNAASIAQTNATLQNNVNITNANNATSLAQTNAQLQTMTSQFNAGQTNSMAMFNSNQLNTIATFNASMESQENQFYQQMQYNVDVANAGWRNQITMQENAFTFQAASTDIQNQLGIQQEALNQIWDRSDSLLNYLWQSSENGAQRAHELAVVNLRANLQEALDDNQGWGALWGTIVGEAAQSFFGDFDWGF